MPKKSDEPKKPLWQRLLKEVREWALFFLILAIGIRLIAPTKLFHPNRDDASHESLLARTDVEHLLIETDRGELSGYLLRGSDEAAPLVLYFGGNMENAATTLNRLNSQQRAAFEGCHFAQVDYPGYGLSDGRPSDASFKRMSLTAYDALSAREDVTDIVVLGYSIGTGPANYVAANREVSGLILMAPYADGVDLFNSVVNIFHGPLKLLVSYNMSSVTFARDIAITPLIFATEQDELVPYASALRLSSAYPGGCQFVTIPGIRHGGFWHSGIVLGGIKDYLAEVTHHE